MQELLRDGSDQPRYIPANVFFSELIRWRGHFLCCHLQVEMWETSPTDRRPYYMTDNVLCSSSLSRMNEYLLSGYRQCLAFVYQWSSRIVCLTCASCGQAGGQLYTWFGERQASIGCGCSAVADSALSPTTDNIASMAVAASETTASAVAGDMQCRLEAELIYPLIYRI